MQAYRGMDIGTAKPSPELRARLPHRLLDLLEPGQQYTLGDFVRLAEDECRKLWASGALPVLSGGTGYYVRGFLCGLPGAPAADPEIRAQVKRDLLRNGMEALRQELRSLDPESEARIAASDSYRLTRAVEITRATGRPLREFAAPRELRRDFDILLIGLDRSREELYRRIDARVDRMFEQGLVGEFVRLLRSGLGPDAPGMKAIGYSEFFELPPAALQMEPEELGLLPELAGVRERIKQDSRRYAKRQLTYLRSLPGIRWMRPEAGLLAPLVDSFLSAG